MCVCVCACECVCLCVCVRVCVCVCVCCQCCLTAVVSPLQRMDSQDDLRMFAKVRKDLGRAYQRERGGDDIGMLEAIGREDGCLL